MNNNFFVWAIWLYVPLSILLKWANMYTGIQNGLFVAVYLLILGGICLARTNFKALGNNGTEKLIGLYFIYNILSALITLNKGYSFSIVSSEIANSLVPIILFYLGEVLSEKEASIFEEIVMFSGIFITIIGLYYNNSLDDPYYIDFLYASQPNFSLHGFTVFPRLCAMLGSVECSTFGFVCVGLSFAKLVKGQYHKFFLFFLSGGLMVFLTLQRGAIACVVFEILICFIYIKNKRSTIFFLIILLFVVFACFFILQTYFIDVFESISYRMFLFDSAVSERSDGWMNAFNNGTMALLFGSGLATGGQRAIGISAATVNDGNYFKIIYDCGLTGLLLLFFILFSVVRKKSFLHYYSILIFCFMLQMIGSNVMTFQFTASFFWYVLGRLVSVNNNNYALGQEASQPVSDSRNDHAAIPASPNGQPNINTI